MNPQSFRTSSYRADGIHRRGDGRAVRSSFCILPAASKPARTNSFIFGLSDSRIRPLLNQEERDRLHCWSMVIAMLSSAAGTALLLMAAI